MARRSEKTQWDKDMWLDRDVSVPELGRWIVHHMYFSDIMSLVRFLLGGMEQMYEHVQDAY